jgi:hypothetical protein
MFRLCTWLVLVLFVVSTTATTALAIPAFRSEFEVYYKVKEPETDAQKALAEKVAVAKCNVCHVDGEKKSVNNPYGIALSELLDKENFSATRRKEEADKVQAEIRAALDKVAEMQSPTEETYGERITAGELPIAPAAE